MRALFFGACAILAAGTTLGGFGPPSHDRAAPCPAAARGDEADLWLTLWRHRGRRLPAVTFPLHRQPRPAPILRAT